ncbi:hypothetical protein VTJ04DRAFT_8069 [Mycothermus thermophilus]|uniref:uncharacterized protein n=1 Tax=Humicola insolens TaxID=85995 RepID=UPI003743517A
MREKKRKEKGEKTKQGRSAKAAYLDTTDGTPAREERKNSPKSSSNNPASGSFSLFFLPSFSPFLCALSNLTGLDFGWLAGWSSVAETKGDETNRTEEGETEDEPKGMVVDGRAPK